MVYLLDLMALFLQISPNGPLVDFPAVCICGGR